MEEISAGEAEDLDSFDSLVWPLCGTFTTLAGCWLVPRVPQSMLTAALATYLDLADDETLLVLLDGGTEEAPVPGCALTTKRVYWATAIGRHARPPHPVKAGAVARDVVPPRCDYLDYRDLPDGIALPRAGLPTIVLGNGREIRPGVNGRAIDALVALLAEARDRIRGGDALPEVPFAARDQARRAWPDVLRANFNARAVQARFRAQRAAVRDFQERTTATARAVVTPFLAGVCVLVFGAMVLSGVSPIDPQGEAMLRWGALSSRLVIEGETWRLITCLFLHFGVLHLALNVWGLVMVGPTVERFYGHLGFAGLYLLSGFGGALASLYEHPAGVCAGASGAIFGVIGGLLAFLVARRRDFPSGLVRAMRSQMLTFVAINLVIGAASPSIDMAGHLGGLASGFVVGLCLAPRPIARPGGIGLLRRAAVITLLSIGLAGLGRTTIKATRAHLLGDEAGNSQARAFVEFQQAGRPVFERIDRTSRDLVHLLKELEQGKSPPDRLLATIDGLVVDTDRNTEQLGALPQRNDAIRAMTSQLSAAQVHLRRALELLRRAIATGDHHVLGGAGGLDLQLGTYFAAEKEFVRLRESYIKANGLAKE